MLEYKVFGEKSIAMLCDRHLNIIASNVSSDDYGKSFEQRFSTLFPPQFFSLLKQQAVRDEPGVVRLKSEKGLLIASISRVESTGWFVVQVAPHTVLSNISSKVVASAAMAVLLVVLLFLFYLRSVYRTNRRLQNENEGHHLNVINALTESYGSAFAVNLETGKVIVYRVNPNVARLMKDLIPRDVSYEQLILMYSKRVVHPEDRSLFERASTLEALNREFIRKDRFEFTYRVVADDKIHYLQAHFVKPSHERAEFVVGFKEIDEAMSAELEKRKELNEQRVALTKALEQAHRADRVKTEFLFNISHDFSVPLNAVLDNGRLAQKMVTEINLNKDENPVVSRYIGNILTAGTQLQEMINMVLDRARIESGKDELNEKPVLMAEIGDKLVATFEQMACQKNILFQVSRNFTVPCIYIDKMKYQQILLNIVSNAIKFTRERGLVRVLLENMPHESDGMCFVRLVVEDTGVGISESFLPKIFDDFEREQSALTRDTYGMGLGLSIVKQLVDLMHGTIEVSSRVGEGTRVVVKTPHRIADPQSV